LTGCGGQVALGLRLCGHILLVKRVDVIRERESNPFLLYAHLQSKLELSAWRASDWYWCTCGCHERSKSLPRL